MRLAHFKTVRGRLLALLIGIALPIACLTAITAVTTYQTVSAAIRTSQMRTAEDYAVRTRVWYRGALRSLLAGGSALALNGRESGDCGKVGGQTLARVAGYRAIYVLPRGGDACAFSLDPEVSAADLAAAAALLQAKPPVQSWAGTELARARYDHVTLGGKRYLAVYAQSDDTGSPMREGLLLVDPELLDQVFDLGDGEPGLVVALAGRGGDIIVSRGTAQPDDASWLPARDLASAAKEPSQAQSRAGVSRVYATRIVADPDFYIVASFDDALGQAARTQFLVLLLAPLLTLALLCVVYLRAIDKHCVRWLRGIEAAARTRSTLTTARAVIADDMPSDIRSVAEAFNIMVEEQEVRQRKLQTALDDNRFLVRELHHRVKNSLQVVQSYIGLTKRDYRGEARMALADAECRVHVLSAAYRFTLADGEMQPVRIDLFVDDVVTMISNLLRSRDQWVASTVDTRASLSVDRIIPLGFLIVDVMSRALRSTPGVSIQISVSDIDDGTVEIAIEADREIAHSAPPKLFAGLVTQIEAIQAGAPEGARLGAWRVAHFT